MSSQSPRIAVYTGSFDPITLGHVNVIERSARLVDRLIVGIGVNVEKSSLFTPEERVRLVQQATDHLPNVEVRPSMGWRSYLCGSVVRMSWCAVCDR